MDATELSPEAKAALQMSVRVIVRARFKSNPAVIEPLFDILGVRGVGMPPKTVAEAIKQYGVPRQTMFDSVREARQTVADVLEAEIGYAEPSAEEPKPE